MCIETRGPQGRRRRRGVGRRRSAGPSNSVRTSVASNGNVEMNMRTP